MAFDKAELKTGFYLGLGLLLALLVWSFVTLALSKVMDKRSHG